MRADTAGMGPTRQVLVRVATEGDHEALLKVLGRVYGANSDYPPRSDTDGSGASLEAWLFAGKVLVRLVATVNDDPVGHVLLHVPGQYLTGRYQALFLNPAVAWIEVGKLFVDPLTPGLGVGRHLLSAARSYITVQGGRLVLCVVETSEQAYRLYVREGLVVIGEFSGVHGRNIVMTD